MRQIPRGLVVVFLFFLFAGFTYAKISVIPRKPMVKPLIKAFSLVARYNFLGNASDISGNGNDGNVFGAVGAADRFGKTNGAYLFNGNSDYIQVDKESSFDLTQFTITVFFKVNKLPYSTVPTQRGRAFLVGKGNNFTIDIIQSNAATNALIGYGHQNSSGNWSTSIAENIDFNQFYQVACTYDGKDLKMYLNGILRKTETNIGPPVLNNRPLLIGKSYDAGSPYFFNGVIDSLQIDNKALTAEEIMQLYTAAE